MAKLRVDKIAAPIVKDEFTGSVYFDGSGDYLSIPTSDDFAFGTGDFTIEMWLYASSSGSYQTPIDFRPTATDGNYPVLIRDTDGDLYYYVNSSRLIDNVSISNNVWYHVAICREEGTTTRLYLDGVLKASATDSTNYITDDINISSYKTGGNYFHGYISNLRICKGHAVYTGNFTPPTRELEVHTGAKGVVFPAADNRTVLLACQSSTDVTAEATGRHTLTANGDATAADANPGLLRKTNVTSTITENTGSVYFSGATLNRLTIEPTSDFAFGTGDFTIEMFVYHTSLTGQQTYFGDTFGGGAGADGIYTYKTTNNEISLYDSAQRSLSAQNVIKVNTWHHVAWTRESGVLRAFVDGIKVDEDTYTGDFTTTEYFIGDTAGTSSGEMVGYISNLRVCKGHAVYTSNFTPPTRELEVHPETVLLACYDGENIFADKTGRHIISAQGARTSSPTPTATDSPIGITTFQPGLTRSVDPTAGPTFQGGVGFVSQNWLTLPKGTTTERNRTGGRGLIMGGYTTVPSAAAINMIEFMTISSSGNAQDFGDLTSARYGGGGCGSSTRGLYGGGEPSKTSIDNVTIASSGDAISFGSLDTGSSYVKACSNQTRGIWGGGRNPNSSSINVVQYVTIPTLANSQDFGDLTSARTGLAALSSPTRGIFSGGYTHPSPTALNTIDYVTIATTGNALDFGDLLTAVRYSDTVSSGTRGVIGGGSTPNTNTIQYITISTLGNAKDFGDLIVAREHVSATDNSIRGVFMGGVTPTSINTLDYVTIATTGNASDFGDLQQTTGYAGGTSDSHGGLG